MNKQKNQKNGFIVSVELMLIVTILVIGLIVGLVPLRNAVIAELNDVSSAIESIDNSYSFDGISYTGAAGTGTTSATTVGSAFNDLPDTQLVDTPVAPTTVLTNTEISADSAL